MLAEGNIFFNAAGTFPENDGRTGMVRKIVLKTTGAI